MVTDDLKFIRVMNEIKSWPRGNYHIEVRGSWIWITGDTSLISGKLSDFKFSKSKQAYYFHSGGYHKRSKRELELPEIRKLYDGVQLC